MLAGAYSQRYKSVSDHHVNQLKERHQSERSQMVARARKVQMETNRRRRALALKRKQEAQREEQRRQEILAKRKQQIREATERYQRANTQYQTIDSLRYDSNRQHQPTPALEEALKLVRGSPGLRRSFSYDGIATLSNSKTSSRPHSHYGQTQNERIQEHVRQVAARTELQSKSVRNLTNSRSLFEIQLEHQQSQLHEIQRASLHHFNSAIHDELQGKSTHNEDQLQHSDSLSSLDSLEAEHEPLSHSDASVLGHKRYIPDANQEAPAANPYSSPATLDFHTNFSPAKLSNAQSNFTSNRNSNSPNNIAIVQPNNAQQGSSNLVQNHRNYISKSTNVVDSKSATVISGAKPVITNDTEFLKSFISKTQNINNSTTNYAQAPSYYDANYPSPISKNYEVNQPSGDTALYGSSKDIVKTRLKAWATPSPVDGSHTQTISVTDNSMITNINPTGVKSTATNQTVTMNVTSVVETKPHSSIVSHIEGAGYASRISKTQARVTEPSHSHYLSGSYYTVKNYAEQSRPQSRPLINTQSRPVVSSQSHNNTHVPKAELVLEEGESDDEQQQMENEYPKQKVPPSPVKSILRKTSSYSDKLGVKGSGYSASLAKHRNNQHTAAPGGITANVSVRDSLEVARQQIDSRQEMQKPAKKSVRFADQLEEEQKEEEQGNEEEKEGEKRLFIPSPPTTKKPLNRRPPRPVSSKTLEAPTTKSVTRTNTSSAGTVRSGIPVTQNTNSVLKKPPPAQNIPKQSESQPTMKDSRHNKGSNVKFDTNGLRLDRTPTDDEINLLWDRVRDCLSRNSSIVESAGDSRPDDSRNSAQVSQRMTDEEIPATQQQSQVHINSTNSYTNRKKVTMEHLTNYSAKKTSALQRQQQQNRMNQTTAPSSGVASGYYEQPSSYIPQNYNKEVSDSMAAFLTAEMLSNRSASASQIGHAINAVQTREPVFSSARQQPKGHSALSIEEQRLLKSLEKLNERLRMTEQTLNPTKIYVPHPPTQIPTYRNQQTINHRRLAGAQCAQGGKNFR